MWVERKSMWYLWPSLVKEPTERSLHPRCRRCINNTTPTGALQGKSHLWGCSVPLQMAAKLLLALAVSGSCPKSRGDVGSKMGM